MRVELVVASKMQEADPGFDIFAYNNILDNISVGVLACMRLCILIEL